MSTAHRLEFFKAYLRRPDLVGAIIPSSQALAAAVCEPYARSQRPERLRVLECGAGTGAITRYLGTILRPTDELDVCELQDGLADILERNVFTETAFAKPVAEGRVRLLRKPVQEIREENHYDFIVSGLPLTAFDLATVEAIMTTIRRCLKPEGVLSYYEYIGLRRVAGSMAMGLKRSRIKAVSEFLTENIRNYQYTRKMVFQNFPPAHARHLRFAS